MTRRSPEISVPKRRVNHKSYNTNQNTKAKAKNKRFNKVRQPTFSGQKGEDSIQTTELQGLQIDPEIQIENLKKLAVEFSQTN